MKQVPTYIKDSVANNLHLEQNYALLQADVEALYPSIQIEDGLESLNKTLLNTNMDPHERILILRLTKWVLKNSYMDLITKYTCKKIVR